MSQSTREQLGEQRHLAEKGQTTILTGHVALSKNYLFLVIWPYLFELQVLITKLLINLQVQNFLANPYTFSFKTFLKHYIIGTIVEQKI